MRFPTVLAAGALLVMPPAMIPFTPATSRSAEPSVRTVGELVLDGIPEFPQSIVDRMNQYQNVRSATPADWAPGGGLLIGTRFADTVQLHHVAAPGAARRQLTFYREPVGGGTYGKDGSWLLFLRDSGGDEMDQMYRLDLATGKAAQLTKGPGQNGGIVWSNARDRVVWRSTARNQRDHDIRVMDPMKPDEQAILVETSSGYWVPMDWSPDDRRLLVQHSVSANESSVWLVDVATKRRTPVGNHGKVDGATISVEKALFDASGDGVYVTSDEGTEFRTLRHLKLGAKKGTPLTADIPWDVGSFVLTKDRGTMAFTVNESGTSRLYVMDLGTKERRAIDVPMGVVVSLRFSDDGRSLAFGLNSPSAPTDVYTIDVATGRQTRWTSSEVGGIDPSLFRACEIVRVPTFDEVKPGERRTVPCLVYKPKGDGPFPVIINIHGGPESQAQAVFSSVSQYAVNELNCAVVYPNVRGSSGFGKTYLKLDNGMKREDSVKDIGAVLDWIAEQKDLDAGRVGVMGGSYGGYMSLACLTHYSDRLRAGISTVGISNFVTFLTNTSEYRRDLRRVEYGDERDPKMRAHLEKISPAANADKIGVPLFVVHGANDPREPASEAEQVVRAVRGKGKEAWFMLAKDEGHGFAKKANADQMGYAMSLFWETYLIGGGDAGTGTR